MDQEDNQINKSNQHHHSEIRPSSAKSNLSSVSISGSNMSQEEDETFDSLDPLNPSATTSNINIPSSQINTSVAQQIISDSNIIRHQPIDGSSAGLNNNSPGLFRPYEVMDHPIGMDLPSVVGTSSSSVTASGATGIVAAANPWLPFMNASFPNFPSVVPSSLYPQNIFNSSQNMMPSFSSYLPGLPSNFPSISSISTNIPRMPSINMPTFNVPSIPSGLPSFNLPSMPSLPNLIMSGRQIKSWNDLKDAVRIAHRRLSEVSSKVPFAFNFRQIHLKNPDGSISSGIRIYFLCPSNVSSETSLHYCDVFDATSDNSCSSSLNDSKTSDQFNQSFNRRHNRTSSSAASESNVDMSGHHGASSPSVISMETADTASMNSLSPSPSMESLQQNITHEPNGPSPSVPKLVADVPKCIRTSFEWKQLIESRFKSSNNSCSMNIEEKLQMERKRIMLSGITSYEFDLNSKRFLFTSGHNLFYFDDDQGSTHPDPLVASTASHDLESDDGPPYLPTRIETNLKSAKMNPQICPSNPDLIAFAAEGNIYVSCIKSGQEVRLTNTRQDDRHCVSAGLPSYVIQEEFRRYTGFWWRPENNLKQHHHSHQSKTSHMNSSSDDVNQIIPNILVEDDEVEDEDGSGDKRNCITYAILYEEIDETHVDVVKIPSYDGQTEEYRFPRPGEQNAISSLRLVTFNYDTITGSILETHTDHSEDFPHLHIPLLHAIFPEYEYLTRVGFVSRNIFWIQLLNRKQTHLVLSLVSVDNSFPPQIIHEEISSKYWLNVGEVLHFVSSGGSLDSLKVGSDLTFIWSSEESGFRHLYSIKVRISDAQTVDDSKHELHQQHTHRSTGTSSGGPSNSLDDDNLLMEGLVHNHQHRGPSLTSTIKSILMEKMQLTSGNWEVSDRDVWIDESNQLIYFIGLKEIPLERHLYVTSLTPPDPKYNPIKRLTDSGFSHTYVSFDSSYKFFVNIQSNISMPPFGYVYQMNLPFNPPKPTNHDHNASSTPVVSEASSSSSSSPKRKSKEFKKSGLGHRRSSSLASEILPKFRKLGLIVTNPFIASIVSNTSSSTVHHISPSDANSLLLSHSPNHPSPVPHSISPLIPSQMSSCLSTINDSIDLLPGLPKPELFTYQLKNSGELIYGVIFKPEFMENGVKYPCMLDIYGGPEVQVVSNSFKGVRNVRRHLLASEGYVVCSFDTRGSHHRGKNFEGHIYKKMGQVEIEDQVEVLQWLSENTGYIDMKRIAIHGWSYGGYLSLMGLAQRPDIFKLGIAGAPVTKWSLYDTGYTERYMDTPFNNPEGYTKGSVISYVDDFPDDENRLLIIHGLMDENVHFLHSVELINALIRAGKPYQLQVSSCR